MTEIPGEFSLPHAAFERQRSMLEAYVGAGRAEPNRGRRFALAVAVAAFAVVVGTATALGVRAFVLDKGFVGLPPEGATPSAPESGQLVVRLVGRSQTDRQLVHAYLYADGRLILARDDNLGLLEQRLTSQGVEELRSKIVATGLFDHDLSLVSRRLALGFGAVDVRVSGRLVRVDWTPPDDPDGATSIAATLEQERALERLDALLAHPTQGLPESAWADKQLRAYVPSSFAVCWEGWPADVSDPQSDPTRILALLPSAARQQLSGKETTRYTGKVGWAGGPYYRHAGDCANVTTAEARSIAAALDAAGIERTDPAAGLQYSFDLPGPSRETARITFESLLPDGEWTNFRSG
jgi:hypothetical protein